MCVPLPANTIAEFWAGRANLVDSLLTVTQSSMGVQVASALYSDSWAAFYFRQLLIRAKQASTLILPGQVCIIIGIATMIFVGGQLSLVSGKSAN